ncbi:hypothetical protein EVAR_64288_1 [Eumeta japonica]|uniref:Uncharacterized protein n=1 Tax=Eumeta variegata TaxID=151549 RepID=A0A4C2A2E0_EUMVA|nr:hypothetical protein EVAR_64288_1 [Eumeta japonica]
MQEEVKRRRATGNSLAGRSATAETAISRPYSLKVWHLNLGPTLDYYRSSALDLESGLDLESVANYDILRLQGWSIRIAMYAAMSAFNNEAPSLAIEFRCFREFRNGCSSLQDEETCFNSHSR